MAPNAPQKTREAVESYALFRPESALVIALTLILTSLSMMGAGWIPGKWWMWLVAGIVAETLLIISTLKDKKTLAEIEDDVFLNTLQPDRIRNLNLKAKVNKALEYHLLILKEIQTRKLKLSPELYEIIEKLDDWILMIYKLALSLDSYQQDPVLQRDFETVPNDLKSLRQKLAYETGSLRSELEKAIRTKERQRAALQDVSDSLKRADLQIDNTLSAMGTVYGQILHLSTQNARVHDAKQLHQDIFEQIDVLQQMNLEMSKIALSSEA